MHHDAGTSTLTTRLVLRLAADLGGDGSADRVLARSGLGDRRAELEGLHGRVPYAVKSALLDAVATELGDPRIGLRLGEAALQDEALAPFRAVVRALGSPEAVLRSVSRVSTRLDTATVFRCLGADPGAARVGWRVLPPNVPNRVDCDYNAGMLRQVTVVFGLPAAEVRHETCQVDGAPECVYEVSWVPRRRTSRRPWRRRPAARTDLDAALLSDERLAILQDAVGDLVCGADLEQTLDRITSRADRALHAPGHLLDVRLPDGTRHVRARGLGSQVADHLGDTVLQPGLQRVGDAEVLAVPVATADRTHGVLAAVLWPGQAFFPEDEAVLAAFARHAAVGLRTSALLAEAREHEETARLLLTVARSLAGQPSVQRIAQAVAEAVPVLSSADRSAVALWESGGESVRVAGASGWSGELADRIARYATDTSQSPELCEIVRHGRPMLVDASGSSWARGVLEEFGVRAMAGVPIAVGKRFVGVVLAHWVHREPPAVLGEPLVERLWGLAGIAGVALENSRLAGEVEWRAAHDALTGLPNRETFEAHLRQLVARDDGSTDCAVLFCDVSRLSRVNESLGHEAGDEVLRQVADRLRSVLREGDVLARYSGDQFVVALPGVAATGLAALGDRVAAACTTPVTVAGEDVFVDLVTGAAATDTPDAPAVSARDLVARAAEDLQRAKARLHGGRSTRTASAHELRLETDLHGALARGEIEVHYQPQVDLVSGRVAAVEALVRWRHPELGAVPPDVFVPLAEAGGLIGDLGAHVLREACATVARWRREGLDLDVAVNVSPLQLAAPDFADLVEAVLLETGLPCRALTVEVTESQVLSEAAVRNGHLARLRGLGVGVSVDDFGTGWSSLTQLRRLPVTEVKIDRSFTAGMTDGDGPVVAGVVGLGRGLGLRVVAEGVETAEQVRRLTALGCDRVQGYLVGRPAPAGELAERLHAGPVLPADVPRPRVPVSG
ncbi:putative bifunctional diguanylate cyclase/phosphodiesterase [Geodermatophilus sp. SYSU D00804]